MQQCPLNSILVIDEMPLIAPGLREVFRAIHPAVTVDHIENIYTALSAPNLAEKTFDLIILGSWPEESSNDIYPSLPGLKEKFGNSRLMIYSTRYDYTLLERMQPLGIDAYIHKWEAIDEVIKGYERLSAGLPYISRILHTLFYDFQLNNSSNSSLKEG